MRRRPTATELWVFWVGTAACTIVWTLLLCLNRQVGYYEATAAIYPTSQRISESLEEKDEVPCFSMRNILNASNLKDTVLQLVPNGEITEQNYHRLIQNHETYDHRMSIHVYLHDSAAALQLATFIPQYAAERYTQDTLSHTSFAVRRCQLTDSPRIVSRPTLLQPLLYLLLSLVFALLTMGTAVYLYSAIKEK